MSEEGARTRVMVVEDDAHTRDALGLLLESNGYEVTLCAGAIQALGHLREATLPDLIVLDLVMPEMSGWEFRIEQKKEPAWENIPVLALSGDHSPQAEAIDATAYLAKPVDERVFLETVERLQRDIRDRLALARASELQRLVSLGELIGGLAHEINNPLAFIGGSLDLLRRQLIGLIHPVGPVDPLGVASALRALERTQVGVERIADVIRCVSIFASAEPAPNRPLDVHAVLESSLQVAENEIRHSALIERDYEALPMVQGDAARLGQVFLNVILNAVRAIRVTNQSEHMISLATRATPGWVSVTIADTASVMDAAARKAMFDPLTSVSTGRVGLHFGLAVSREIVEAMGGSIEVSGRQARGAAVCIKLPSVSEETYEPPVKKRLLLQPKSRMSIMVVDDEPLMCEVLAAMLSTDYEVTAFTSPRAALAAMVEGSVDLILCDVMMPELSGIDLYDRLERERPDLTRRFVFITGGAFTERVRFFLKRIDRPIIAKPFARQELLSVIQETLLEAEQSRAQP